MRTIPQNVTDPAKKTRLEKIAKEIDDKMKQVEILKVKMRSDQTATQALQDLKSVSVAIDQLDQEWKTLIA